MVICFDISLVLSYSASLLVHFKTIADRPGDADDRSRLARPTSVAAPARKEKKWFKKFQNAGRVGPRGLFFYT
jgi:hypothetical protein